MNLGIRREAMSCKTRIDGRSKDNNKFTIKDSKGNVVAEVRATHNKVNLDVSTSEGYSIEKPNGWTSGNSTGT